MKAALPPGFPYPLNYGQNAPIERPEGGGSEYNAYDEAAAETPPPAPMAYQHSMPSPSVSAAMANMTMAPSEPSDHA